MNLRDELNAFYYSTALCDLRLMNKTFAARSVTYNTLLYLEIIHSLDGTATVSRLASLLCVSKPGVTEKVNELIRNGFVYKRQDPADRRRHYLFVDEKAVPQFGIYRRQDDLVIKRITERFPPEDIRKFCRMLRIMTDVNHDETDSDAR